ncbi:MAG TPA: AraC family transcriptional regulator [Bacilli bacterium]|nr:AraC family transcriptional regulator [Bacilli bacterium]
MGVDANYYENKKHGEPEFPIRLYESVYSGFKNCYLHWHKEFELMHVIKGEADVYIDGHIFNVHPGDIVFVSRNELHQIRQVMGADFLTINAIVFDLSLLSGHENDLVEKAVFKPLREGQTIIFEILHPGDPGYDFIIERIITIEDNLKTKPKMFEMLIKSEMYALFFNLARFGYLQESHVFVPQTNQLRMIKKAAAFLSEHLSERITIKQLAEKFGYSEFHFSRLFKKHTGNTINDFINEMSINRSKALLTRSDLSLDEIAQEVGFSNAGYFIQVFKRHNSGLTPNKYRILSQK